MLGVHAQKPITTVVMRPVERISCVPDKYCNIKWLTMLLKEYENTWKFNCEKGLCLCTKIELLNFLNSPKILIACSSPDCKLPRVWTGASRYVTVNVNYAHPLQPFSMIRLGRQCQRHCVALSPLSL